MIKYIKLCLYKLSQIIKQQRYIHLSMNEKEHGNITMSNGFFRAGKRFSQTAADTHDNIKLFNVEEMENIKLNELRQRRRQLQQKLMKVSNRLNFRKKKQQQQLKRFFKSQQKSLNLLQTQNYKKFHEMLKEQFIQKRQFEVKKKAKQVQDTRSISHRKLNLIYQAVRDRKQEQSQKMRNLKKIDEQNLKHNREMAYSLKRQQCDAINKMKQRQSARKRCYWFQKRMTFQQKLIDQAQIYQKQIQNYYRKIQVLKQSEDQLRQQEVQAQEILRCAQRNLQLLKQS